jgi:signal transduction histidine kinase
LVQDPQDFWGESSRPRPRQILLDVLAAGVFTLFALVSAMQQPVLVVVGTLTMGLALALRRVSWPAMALLATATGVCQLVAGELVVLADLGFSVVSFVLGAHPRAWVRRLGLGGVLAAALVVSAAVATGAIGDAASGGSAAFAAITAAALATLVSGGGWTLGYLRWQTRQRVTAQVQAGLEQERTRIAADMHDLVAHTWAVVAAQADGARYALGDRDGDRKAAEAMELIAETARVSISDLRDLLTELRYQEPATPSGRSSRDALVERMRASGMDVRLLERGHPSASAPLAVAAQRLLAESLTNALKHGDLAHPVDVEEDWRDGYRLVVRNRVRGSSDGLGSGHGLSGMRDRVIKAGGAFDAGASDGTWTVRAVLPEPDA